MEQIRRKHKKSHALREWEKLSRLASHIKDLPKRKLSDCELLDLVDDVHLLFPDPPTPPDARPLDAIENLIASLKQKYSLHWHGFDASESDDYEYVVAALVQLEKYEKELVMESRGKANGKWGLGRVSAIINYIIKRRTKR